MPLFDRIHAGLKHALHWRGARSSEVTLRGHRIHFYALEGKGSGPPVLLLHGVGSSANGFYKVMFPLARRFRKIYALDLPGNGFSPLPASGPVALQEHVEVVKAFLREVIGEKAFLVGNSLGGAMAITTAHQAPEQLAALGLVAPAGGRVEESRMAELFRAMSVSSLSEAWALTRRLFHRVPVGALLFVPELRRMYGTPAVRAVFKEAEGAAFLEPEVLRSLPMPTLLIWGESEKLLPFESIDYFRAHLPRAGADRRRPRLRARAPGRAPRRRWSLAWSGSRTHIGSDRGNVRSRAPAPLESAPP